MVSPGAELPVDDMLEAPVSNSSLFARGANGRSWGDGVEVEVQVQVQVQVQVERDVGGIWG